MPRSTSTSSRTSSAATSGSRRKASAGTTARPRICGGPSCGRPGSCKRVYAEQDRGGANSLAPISFPGALFPSTLFPSTLFPSAFEHPQPVAVAQFLDQRLGVAARPHRLNQSLEACGVAQVLRNQGAVEIRPEADMVLAGLLEHVLDVIDDELDGRVAVLAAVLPQEAHRKIYPGHAAGFADRVQLPVG